MFQWFVKMAQKPNNNACFICFQTSAKNPGISLHRFPTNRQQRNLWLIACGLTEDDYKSSRRICSLHFEKDCFNKYNVRKCLYPGSVPTIFPESYNNHGYKNSKRKSHDRISYYSMVNSQYVDSSQHASPSLCVSPTQYVRPSLCVSPTPYVSPSLCVNPTPYVSPSLCVSPTPYVSPSLCVDPTPYVSPSLCIRPTTPYVSPSKNVSSPLPSSEENIFHKFDNVPNEYSTIWVCRICLCALLSENAVRNHSIKCKSPNKISDFEESE